MGEKAREKAPTSPRCRTASTLESLAFRACQQGASGQCASKRAAKQGARQRARVHLPRAEARAKGSVVHQCAPVARGAGRREERLVTEPRQHVREDTVAAAVQQGGAPDLGAGPQVHGFRWAGSRHGTPAARAAHEPAGAPRRCRAGPGSGSSPRARPAYCTPRPRPTPVGSAQPTDYSSSLPRYAKNKKPDLLDPLLGVRRGEGSRNPVSLK